MKRTLWSILTAAVAAVLPGMTGPSVDLAAPAPQAVNPAPEAVQVRKVEVREEERVQDDLDDDPSPRAALSLDAVPGTAIVRGGAAVRFPKPSPGIAPLARRALGLPRARAPDRIV